MKLKVNDRATFRTYNGIFVTGKIVVVAAHCYCVKGDSEFCTMFSDGLFRFTDYHLVNIEDNLKDFN